MTSSYQDLDENYSTPPVFPYGKEEKGASLLKELSPQESIRDMVENFRGKIWDSNQKKYVEIKGMKPFMNDEGIESFFHYSTAILSPVVTMSNYAKNYKMIHRLMLVQMKKAIKHFYLHYEDYEIKSKTRVNIVTSKLLILGLSAFYKAIGAGDRTAATANISETISRMSRMGDDSQQQKPKSIIERMFRR